MTSVSRACSQWVKSPNFLSPVLTSFRWDLKKSRRETIYRFGKARKRVEIHFLRAINFLPMNQFQTWKKGRRFKIWTLYFKVSRVRNMSKPETVSFEEVVPLPNFLLSELKSFFPLLKLIREIWHIQIRSLTPWNFETLHFNAWYIYASLVKTENSCFCSKLAEIVLCN